MQLSDLTDEQKVLLAAWFILADASPPSKDEPLPVECVAALAELSESTGKYGRSRLVRGSTTRGNKRISTPAHTGLLHGKRRRVRCRKALVGLAT
jgi:hypothetical protein